MRISVKETGGFAGLSTEIAAVDTARLDAASAQQLEQAVQAAGFFELPGRVGEAVGADLMLYEVTVGDGGREHAVAFARNEESPATASLHRLVAVVRQQ